MPKYPYVIGWFYLLLIILISPAPADAETTPSASASLLKMRSAHHSSYTSFVFEFDAPFTFQTKQIKEGMEVILPKAKTVMAQHRQFSKTGLGVTLSQSKERILATVTCPFPFKQVLTDTLKNPYRLALHFYPENAFLNKKIPGKAPTYKKRAKKVDKISLSFFNGDIREILSGLAIQQEINIVTEPTVAGKVSVHLHQLPLETAIDAIARAGNFRYKKRGKIYFIYKPGKDETDVVENLKLHIFKLQYAEVDKVQDILSAIQGIRMIKIHEPTKTIIVEDTPSNIRRIEKVIRVWDEPPIQVLIEAKILEISLTNDMSLGVNWQRFFDKVAIGTGGFSTSPLPTSSPTSPIPLKGAGLFANMITGAGTDQQFAAALSALQNKTRVETLSTPKILAIHGKKAKVQVGGKQGYRVTTTNLGVVSETIKFIDTGTILEITPYIDGSGNTLLNVTPSINTARIEEDGIPVVNSTVVSTWLRAKNGETVFIGGLIQNTQQNIKSGIPCLGSVPFLSYLFGSKSKGSGKTELVVLIKPIIVTDPSLYSKDASEKAKELEKIMNAP